jgi:hypothetical protein
MILVFLSHSLFSWSIQNKLLVGYFYNFALSFCSDVTNIQILRERFVIFLLTALRDMQQRMQNALDSLCCSGGGQQPETRIQHNQQEGVLMSNLSNTKKDINIALCDCRVCLDTRYVLTKLTTDVIGSNITFVSLKI